MHAQVADYLQIGFRRKFIFLYPYMIVFFLMAMLAFIMPKTYEAATLILIEEARIINPLVSDLALSTPMDVRLFNIREQILGWNSLTELVRRLKLDKDVKSAYEYESLIKKLRASIIVTMVGNDPMVSQVVSIVHQGSDPVEVQGVTLNIGDIFIQQNIQSQVKETELAISFLEEQLRFYRRKIHQDEIKRLDQELEQLRLTVTEQHPMVKDIKERIALLTLAMETDAEDINLAFPDSSRSSQEDRMSYLMLQQLKKDPSQGPVLDIEMNKRIQEQAAAAAARGVGAEQIAFDANVNRIVYQRLLERLETARITQKLQAFAEGTRFTILEPARLPLTPIKPNKIAFILMGIVLGVGAGTGCVYLAEKLDTSFHSVQEAKQALRQPVLAAIPAIITEEEYARRKSSARFSYLMAVVFFILLSGIVTVAWLMN